MHADMKSYNIYARYLVDVDKIDDLDTYPLSSDDIVDNNRNYRRAIGYAIDVAFISNNFSDTPTEWGLADRGKYFEPPYMDKRFIQSPGQRGVMRRYGLGFI